MLAGQSELIEAFRKTSKYEHILATELVMEDEHADGRKIYQLARHKIDELFDKEKDARLEAYFNSIATPLTSSMPNNVIPAAYYSQVRTLFIEKGAHVWGHFDELNNQLTLHDEKQDGDDCMIDKAAIQTVLHGGEVFILEKEKMPNGAMIAALLRYDQ